MYTNIFKSYGAKKQLLFDCAHIIKYMEVIKSEMFENVKRVGISLLILNG